jgi:exonuclease SbcC
VLEKLVIRNFQKHKKLEIDFDEHISCIIGKSDVGKSAVLRALKWVCTNRPSGSGFIRHGSKACDVRLRIDGKTITRLRSRQDNIYSLNSIRYAALGQGGVPDEVSKLLNISSSLNFQNQMDSPFWFMLTPGEVSRQINQIVNLELIDKTLANVASQLRKVKSTVSVCEERLEKTENKVKELAWTVEADKELQELELLYKEIQSRTCRNDLCRTLVKEVSRLRSEQQNLAQMKEDGLVLMVMAEELLTKQEKQAELKELVAGITRLEESLEESKKEVKRLNAQLEKEMDGKCPLCKQTLDRKMSA